MVEWCKDFNKLLLARVYTPRYWSTSSSLIKLSKSLFISSIYFSCVISLIRFTRMFYLRSLISSSLIFFLISSLFSLIVNYWTAYDYYYSILYQFEHLKSIIKWSILALDSENLLKALASYSMTVPKVAHQD